jgi:hypothetical protein
LQIVSSAAIPPNPIQRGSPLSNQCPTSLGDTHNGADHGGCPCRRGQLTTTPSTAQQTRQ